jgi:glycosyltransferase involved in cell wall biosynthesis
MPAPLLLDLSHTSHTRARTGIQRVTRALHTALADRAIAITHDPHLGAWRELEPWERANLASDSAGGKRGAQWPLAAKLRSRARRVLGSVAPSLPANAGLIVPEVFSPDVAAALPTVFAAAQGPRVALFHDAIALKFPELTPPKTVARFPSYLIELLPFDGIAAVSNDSRDALLDYWRWLGVKRTPPVQTISLGVEPHRPAQSGENSPRRSSPDGTPIILSVGSIEGRKNHLALLDACEKLWQAGVKFSLHLIGLAQPQTGAAALARIRALQAAGRSLRYDGPVTDADLSAAYAGCTFTVYPSLIEGFGLPVIESLAQGKPCVCSARGALGESARGGGCVMLENVDAATLAPAIARLLATPAEVAALATQARTRQFKTWADYGRELTEWLRTLPRR